MVPPNHTHGRGAVFRRQLIRLLVLLAVCAPWFNIVRDNADSAGMLAHLHGMFVDGDVLYDNEMHALGLTPTFAFVTREGVVSNHWPAGATWLQAPGYGLGLLAARALEPTGLRFNPYGAVPLLAVRTLAMLLLVGLARMLARVYTEAAGTSRAGVVAQAAWIAGTPLLYYASEAPLRPHVWGFGAMLCFVLAWRSRGWGTPMSRAVVLGALLGLATGIRPQLAPIWLLVAEDAWHGSSRDRLRRLGAAAVAASVWPLLHLRLQFWMYGADLGGYASETTHHVRAFLLSPYHGVLTWSPVVVLGFLALGWAVSQRERAAWLLFGLFVHQIWLDSGMRDIGPYAVLGTRTWSGGTSFGARKLLDALPLLLPSTLGVVASARKHRGRLRLLAAFTLALVVPTLALLAASFVDPNTTGALLDWRGYAVVLERPLSASAWGDAALARAVPLKVWAALVVLVALPLSLAATRTSEGLAAVTVSGASAWPERCCLAELSRPIWDSPR
ncbi:MAG: hypothetical protein KUG77_26930 [Nannocystaceae bacterium]|nr:hypothetical protein [Nannocystaceae bacterium]